MQKLAEGGVLTTDEADAAITQIIDAQASEVEIAGFLGLVAALGETADLLAGAVRAVRRRMTALELAPKLRPVLDTCGTGGDGAGTVNISSAVAIIVAACGVRVAKHGNRSASGRSGSADVFTTLGIKIDAVPSILELCLAETGIAFLFAPQFHPALRHAAPVRKQLPFRTLFNLVGPLANPARAEFQLIGVPDRERAELVAATIARLQQIDGSEAWPRQAVVVYSSDGLDEVSLGATTYLHHVGSNQAARVESVDVQDFKLPAVKIEDLVVPDVDGSARAIHAVLAGEQGPVRDTVLANAAVALKMVGKATDLAAGVQLGARAIDTGAAAKLLKSWADISHQTAS